MQEKGKVAEGGEEGGGVITELEPDTDGRLLGRCNGKMIKCQKSSEL